MENGLIQTEEEKQRIPDPYDMARKQERHSKADKMNFLALRRENIVLCCGAKKKNATVGRCRSIAGAGTDHPGYGRCKFCGGSNTGPKTPEGKAKMALNPIKHGFYSKVLRDDERLTYEALIEGKALGLMDEIYMMKAKILTYIAKWQGRIDEGGEKAARNYITSGIDQERSYYTASTADDRVLQRALETLRRLVDSHSKLTNVTGDDLISDINKELKAASQGEVTLAWKTRPAQARQSVEDDV